MNRWKLEFSKPSLTGYITRVLHGVSLSVFELTHTFETCYFPLWISPLGRSRDPKVFTPTFPVSDGDFTRADMAHPAPRLFAHGGAEYLCIRWDVLKFLACRGKKKQNILETWNGKNSLTEGV